MVSICEIGSVARRENDAISDRDLLAVGSATQLEPALREYRAGGWNVCLYSKSEFDGMAESGSLFVQHVKQDGRIIRDDEEYLQRKLKKFIFDPDYLRQLSCATGPIHAVTKIEKSYWGKLFQADVLYVAVRNGCIFHRATIAKPDFDFKRLVTWASKTAGLTSSDIERLLSLRALKHAYRSRYETIDVSALTQIAFSAKKLANYWDQLTEATISEQSFSNGYFEVRALEGQLVRAVGPIYMDALPSNHKLAELWSSICSSDIYKPRTLHLPRWSHEVVEFLGSRRTH